MCPVFVSEFTNHELKLQISCCHKPTQGEENSGIGKDKWIVEKIHGLVQVKQTFKLRTKWVGFVEMTLEPISNLKGHEECECCNQFSRPFFCFYYNVLRFGTYLILTGIDEYWRGIWEQAREEYNQKKELAKKEREEEKRNKDLNSSKKDGGRIRKPATHFSPEDDRKEKLEKRKV